VRKITISAFTLTETCSTAIPLARRALSAPWSPLQTRQL
jgi:hypothetical protein